MTNPFCLLCATGFLAIFSSTLSKNPVLPLFAAHLGADPAQVGMVAAVSAFTGIGLFLSSQMIVLAVSKPMFGRFSDRYGRRGQIIGGALLGAVAMGALSRCSTFLPLLLTNGLFGISLSVLTSAPAARMADLSRRETYGSAMGMLGSVMDIGHTTGPLVAGLVAATYGFGMSFVTASIILLAAAALFALVPARQAATTE